MNWLSSPLRRARLVPKWDRSNRYKPLISLGIHTEMPPRFLRSLAQATRTALLTAAIVLSEPAASRAISPAELACANRNPSLTEYTFGMSVAMRMRHFPWLGFHLAGTGRYVRGQSHVVNFTQVPFFAKGFSQVDLSPLDPCIWPRLYAVTALGTRDGMSTFSLRPQKVDPRDKNSLIEAMVMLDSADSTREVILHYSNGSIVLTFTPASINGYRLPSRADVSIDMPGRSLSAHAEFTNYALVAGTSDVSSR